MDDRIFDSSNFDSACPIERNVICVANLKHVLSCVDNIANMAELQDRKENIGEKSASKKNLALASGESDSDSNSNSGSAALPLKLLLKPQPWELSIEKIGKKKVSLPQKLHDSLDAINMNKYNEKVPQCFNQLLGMVANVRLLASNDHIVGLQTFLHNRLTTREDFVFNADRLIRLVIEEGLNHLPYNEKTIYTPTGETYKGVEYLKSNCGVSIVRSGEAMEKALRDCCRSIRIGKILIHSNEDSHEPRVLYAKLPPDISLRKVLLLYPIMGTGKTVLAAIQILLNHGVKECNIILINLFSTPNAIRAVSSHFSGVTIQTTDVHPVLPANFGKRYFGTD